MRLILLLLMQAFAFNIVFGQDRICLESPEAEQRMFSTEFIPKVKGQLLHVDRSTLKQIVVKYKLLVPGLKGQKTKLAPLNPDGSFELVLDYGLPYQQVWLTVGEKYRGSFLVTSDLNITLDYYKINNAPVEFIGDGVTFSGQDSALAYLLAEFQSFKPKKKSHFEKKQFSILMERSSANQKTEQLRKAYGELVELRKEFFKERDRNYEWIFENEMKSEMYSDILSAHIGRGMDEALMSEILAHVPLVISDSSNKFYDLLSLKVKSLSSHEEKMIVDQARQIEAAPDEDQKLINKFLDVVERKRLGMDYDQDFYDAGIDWYNEKYKAAVREARLDLELAKLKKISPEKTTMVLLKGQPYITEERAFYLEKMLPEITSTWCTKLMKSEFKADCMKEERLSNILSQPVAADSIFELGLLLGSTANGSRLYQSNAQDPDELLTTIRNYYPGSAVIVNIWSVWCASCVSDMRQSKYLKNKLSNLPVEIVYLHINENATIEMWKDVIGETMVSGDHIYLDEKLSVQLMENLDLQGFPSNFLIDIKGKYDPNCISSISQLEGKELRAFIGDSDEVVLEK